jgi:alpha-glucosidase
VENDIVLQSPDGKIQLTVSAHNHILSYAVEKENTAIVLPSRLGFVLANSDTLNKFEIVDSKYASLDETWEQPWGECRYVRNHYNELTVLLKETKNNRKINVRFRLFNDGLGFRYEFPEQASMDSVIIMREDTEFKMPHGSNAWWIPADDPYYECITQYSAIHEMDTVRTPLVLEFENGQYISIHEANLTDYPKMNLWVKDATTLCSSLVPWSTGVAVYTKAPFVTPWRTIVIGEKPGDLVTSHLMLNLNEPCRLEDISWIEPGKYIGIWWEMHLGKGTWYYGPQHGATTANTKKYIDFAAKNGIAGVLVEGWNTGWEGNWMKHGDLWDFTKPYPDFDIKEITNYAGKKGVRLVGHHETAAAVQNYEQQLDKAFAFYQQYGVRVVKTGYVNRLMDFKEAHDGQYGVRHYRKVVETAAKYQIAIDNHEPVMPTGLQRTYPNLMTQEGVRGQEWDAWSPDGGNSPEHTTIVPFTRGLAGPMDFTFGTFNFTNKVYPGTRVNTTLCKQLALFVVIYSPLQMASDLPENYEGVKAFDFIRDVPTNWDETKVLDAKIGDYCITARKDRHSDDWYVGCITDEQQRELTFSLDFLSPDSAYKAQIYADGDKAEWRTNPTDVKYEERIVTSAETLRVKLATSGGCAIRFIRQ